MTRGPAGWRVALGLSLGPAVANGLARFAYGLVLPSMREDLAWSYAAAGWINTANALGYLAGAVLAFWLIRRVDQRILFVAGLLLTALSLLACGFTRDVGWLTVWRVMAGIGGAPAFIAGGALVSTLFRDDPRRNALAIAVYFGGGGFGMLATGIGLPLLLDVTGTAGWPLTWVAMGLAALASLVPAAIAARAVEVPPLPGGQAGGVLPVAAMAPALAGYFMFAVGYIVYLTFIVAWMRTSGATPGAVALSWAAMAVAVVLSPFAWRPLLARVQGGAVLALACLTTAVGTILPLFGFGSLGFLLSGVVFGLALFIGPTSVTAFSRKNLPQSDWGRAVALFTILFAAGQTVGPVAAGLIADQTASIGLGLFAAALVLMAGAGLAALQRPLARP